MGTIHAIGDYSKRKGPRQDFSPFSTKFFLIFCLFCRAAGKSFCCIADVQARARGIFPLQFAAACIIMVK
jgi:hypothetical protein